MTGSGASDFVHSMDFGWINSVLRFLLRSSIIYFLVSIGTIPIAGSIWLGELPLLALIQVPKLAPAIWFRSYVVMPWIVKLGYSAGSFSPDYLMARPYGLLFPYVIFILLILLMLVLRLVLVPRLQRERMGILVFLSLFFAAGDYLMILWLAGGPGFTMY